MESGKSFAQIARDFGRSSTIVYSVCIRIEKILEKKGYHYNEYKDLLKYKNGAVKRKGIKRSQPE